MATAPAKLRQRAVRWIERAAKAGVSVWLVDGARPKICHDRNQYLPLSQNHLEVRYPDLPLFNEKQWGRLVAELAEEPLKHEVKRRLRSSGAVVAASRTGPQARLLLKQADPPDIPFDSLWDTARKSVKLGPEAQLAGRTQEDERNARNVFRNRVGHAWKWLKLKPLRKSELQRIWRRTETATLNLKAVLDPLADLDPHARSALKKIDAITRLAVERIAADSLSPPTSAHLLDAAIWELSVSWEAATGKKAGTTVPSPDARDMARGGPFPKWVRQVLKAAGSKHANAKLADTIRFALGRGDYIDRKTGQTWEKILPPSD